MLESGRNNKAVRRRQSGTYTLELALVLPVFFILVFGVIDFSRLMFTQITVQHAVREGGRFGVTGNQLEDPDDDESFLTRVESIKQIIENSAVGVDINAEDIVIYPVDTPPVEGEEHTDDAGDADELFTISLTYSVQLATPIVSSLFDDGAYTFTANTTFRNEPFAGE